MLYSNVTIIKENMNYLNYNIQNGDSVVPHHKTQKTRSNTLNDTLDALKEDEHLNVVKEKSFKPHVKA